MVGDHALQLTKVILRDIWLPTIISSENKLFKVDDIENFQWKISIQRNLNRAF